MQHRYYRVVTLFVGLYLLLGGQAQASVSAIPTPHKSVTVLVPASSSTAAQRQDYAAAVAAIDRGKWTEYAQLRPGLDGYPLAMYLDYKQLTRQVRKVSPAQVRRFIDSSKGSPLPNRLRVTYLREAGKSRRWSDFLAVMPSEPRSVDLKCYYFRAKLATGDSSAAWQGAKELWVHGKSQPKPCDPLFKAWIKAGELNDDVVWARMLKTFEARKKSLLRYVARKGSSKLRPWSDKLLTVYAKPSSLKRQSLPASSPYSADIATQGLAYLARYNPIQALEYWEYYQLKLTFSLAQRKQIETAIALQSLFAKAHENDVWLRGALVRLQSDKLVEIRLRWALAEQDWPAVEMALPLLSAIARQKGVWRYWQADTSARSGDTGAADAIFQSLAMTRDYYGFLAADRLGKAYTFNNQPLVLQAAASAPLAGLPAIQRIAELYFHDEDRLAHAEWFKVLRNSPDASQQQALAQLASEQGWYRLAIDAANEAKAYNALDVRFPAPYQQTFKRHALAQQVPSTELMAIARRESAFFPSAQSPVGARGLMQIMPATGKQVASQIGKPHTGDALYDVEHNVLLGSAYYRQLLDRFSGNRVYALTAYNAGPHRVDRWRNTSGAALPVELWIETIPYKETRNYVQAVLSYNLVFKHLLGDNGVLLSGDERTASY